MSAGRRRSKKRDDLQSEGDRSLSSGALGFVMLHRSLMDHPLWKKKPFDEGRAWVDMIMMASWHSGHAGGGFKVRRGEFVMSTKALADKWGWTRAKVRRFLDRLEADGQIRRRSNNTSTLISLVNYDRYQGRPSRKTGHPQSAISSCFERGNWNTSDETGHQRPKPATLNRLQLVVSEGEIRTGQPEPATSKETTYAAKGGE